MVGNPGELEAAKIIESRFKEIGLKNVHLEPFKVMTSYHKLSELELLEPICEALGFVSNERFSKCTFTKGFFFYPHTITIY